MRLFKKVPIPSGEKELDAYESWTVRWSSRQGEYSSQVQKETEVFLDKESAEAFAQALKDAFKLLRHTSGTRVTVEKN